MPGVLSTLLGFTGEPLLVQYLVIAGGGGGGSSGTNYGGGGGAGGYRSSVLGEVTGGGGSPEQRFNAVLGTQYAVAVGGGGPAGTNGVNSSIFGIVSTGGGAGRGSAYGAQGFTGGSGGGGTYVNGLGGLRTTTPIQGYPGGVGSSAGNPPPQTNAGSGGGGGAGGPGYDLQVPGFNRNSEGSGGLGLQSSITGTPTFYAAGGVGSSYYSTSRTNDIGGGATGGVVGGFVSNVGTINTGSGGGGGVNGAGGVGGSGIIILRYPVSYTVTIGAGLVGTTTISGTNRVTRITSGTGNISFSYATGLQSFIAQYLVVAGGGAGGTRHGGGGGAGGLVEGSTTLFTDAYSVSVGAGGAGRVHSNGGLPGAPSSAFGVLALGGGGGHGFPGPTPSGGSGGGAADSGGGAGSSSVPGSGLQPASASGGFGNTGGLGQSNPWYGGGGGGAGAVGGNVQTSVRAGSGGAGRSSSITGTPVTYAGGGGGASWQGNPSNLSGFGGAGGGANGAINNATPAGATANTGGGGGAHGGESTGFGGNGGSGVVIVRYPQNYRIFSSGLTATTVESGSTDNVTTITAGTGNIIFAPSQNFDGSTEQKAAPSAEFLRTEFNITRSGNYWIKPTGYSGTAKLLWCDMENQGGGWVLIGKGRASTDNNSGWFGTNSELSVTGLRQENAFAAGISKVDQEFVNRLMNGTTSGWTNGNARNYMVVNRISNATDGFSGVGDSYYHKITNQAQFSWVNQFGSTPNDQQIASGTGVIRRFGSIWLGGSQISGDASVFRDNDFGSNNGTGRLFTWHWTGHGALHGWSSGSSEFRGQMSGNEGHALQFVQLWAR
jgi:hypothetical protein